MKILISGAGVGGLALAGFLKDNPDFQCTLVDKANDVQHGGFSIGLWSNGRAMLQKLGAGEKLDAVCVPIKKLSISTGDGSAIANYSLTDFYIEFGQAIVHVPRTDLHQWLMDAAGNPVIRRGVTITALRENEDGVAVVFSDGAEEKYDLVVGADGIHSSVRELSIGRPEQFENWRVWWLWSIALREEPHTAKEYVETGTFVALFNEGERTLGTLFARMDHTVWDEEHGRIERLKKLFAATSAVVPKIFEGLADKDVMPSDLMSVFLPYWRTGRTVLIGDAAHAMAPFVALGASLALEDAYVLAGELCRAPQAPEQALKIYEGKRVPRVKRAQELTLRMRMLDTVASGFWRRAINVAIPAVPTRLAMHSYLSLLKEDL